MYRLTHTFVRQVKILPNRQTCGTQVVDLKRLFTTVDDIDSNKSPVYFEKGDIFDYLSQVIF